MNPFRPCLSRAGDQLVLSATTSLTPFAMRLVPAT